MSKAAWQVRNIAKIEISSGGALVERVRGRTNTQIFWGAEQVGLAERTVEGWCGMHICQRIRWG